MNQHVNDHWEEENTSESLKLVADASRAQERNLCVERLVHTPLILAVHHHLPRFLTSIGQLCLFSLMSVLLRRLKECHLSCGLSLLSQHIFPHMLQK